MVTILSSRFAIPGKKDMRGVWTAVSHVTIENSMIKFMGRAVTYVQYVPTKPIKHGIKVFAVFLIFMKYF